MNDSEIEKIVLHDNAIKTIRKNINIFFIINEFSNLGEAGQFTVDLIKESIKNYKVLEIEFKEIVLGVLFTKFPESQTNYNEMIKCYNYFYDNE